MGGNTDSWKVRQPANRLHTVLQTVTTGGEKIDLSVVPRTEDVVSITLIPVTADTIELQGATGEDWVGIKSGITIGIDVDQFKPDDIPTIKATSATQNVAVLIATFKR